jgi:hypothetical protein
MSSEADKLFRRHLDNLPTRNVISFRKHVRISYISKLIIGLFRGSLVPRSSTCGPLDLFFGGHRCLNSRQTPTSGPLPFRVKLEQHVFYLSPHFSFCCYSFYSFTKLLTKEFFLTGFSLPLTLPM